MTLESSVGRPRWSYKMGVSQVTSAGKLCFRACGPSTACYFASDGEL